MMDKRILIVDDEEDSVAFVRAVLEEDFAGISSANDGEAGLAAAEAETPDLIILDVQMPKKDGFQVFQDLQRNEATRGIPVIMLTGIEEKSGLKFSREDMGKYFGAEPKAYVEKPVDPETLRATVDKVLAGA